MALTAGTGTQTIMLQGYFTNSSWALTVGGIIYLDVNNGGITQIPPSGAIGSGICIQTLGTAISATTIYFSPSMYYIEL